MLLYIHGFRTTKESHKAQLLESYYNANNIIIADHSLIPHQAIKDLEKSIEANNITGIIASSLGGYYATYLSEKYNLKTVLINPSVRPYETLVKALGENERQDGLKFTWKEEHLSMLKEFKVEKSTIENYFLFLQKGDEVLDYRIADTFYKGCKLIIEEGGNHRFKGFGRFFDEVSKFLNH